MDRLFCQSDRAFCDREGVAVGEIGGGVDHTAENRKCISRIPGNKFLAQLSFYYLKTLFFDLHRAGCQEIDPRPLF